jgi:hypothetical protein
MFKTVGAESMQTFERERRQPDQQMSPGPARHHRTTSETTQHSQLIPRLQGSLGNQETQRLSQTQPAHGFGPTQAGRGRPSHVQAKPKVDTPGDSFEQEADRVSDHLMHTSEAQPQRDCACGGDCSECGAERDAAGARPSSSNIEQPVPDALRQHMERSLGADFSDVRIHTGAEAARKAEEIGAKAFTRGSDIYINEGHFDPQSAEGRKLIAHELVHVLQQRGADGSTPDVQRIPKSEDELEGTSPRYSYSENCGWLDWGHINPTLAKHLIEAVAEASRKMFRKETPQRTATYYKPKLVYEDTCPADYARGERARSRSDTGALDIVSPGNGMKEYRLSGFEVGKADTGKLQSHIETIDNDVRATAEAHTPPFSVPYEIFVNGYSDCIDEPKNTALRKERATQVYYDLYTSVASKYYLKSHSGASLNEFMETNATEEGRRKNRGVSVLTLPDYSVEPEEFETPYMEAKFKKWFVDAGLTRVKSMFTLYRSLDYNEQLGVALWIFKNLSVKFEEEQLWTESVGHSYFSEEDLPSNLIGFYMAAQGVEPADVRAKIGPICDVYEPYMSKVMYRMWRWNQNRDFIGLGTQNTWPGEFAAITPISPGKPIYELIGYEGASAWSWFFEDAEGHRSER